MTPEHATKLVARWVRLYTRDLPAPVAERRIGEIDADLHDHIAHERARGTSERRIAAGIVARMVRGLRADASWHDRHSCGTKIGTRSIVRVALVTAVILLIPLVAMQFNADWDWQPGDFVVIGTLLASSGLLVELALKNPRNIRFRAATTVIGVLAIAFGIAGDGRHLVVSGFLLIGGTVALSMRSAGRRPRA
jgi:peptidoglycan/LPS O-acetylase OafA/YrhL